MNDFLMDETGDLLIGPDGDFVLGDATVQHQRDILESEKGWYKHAPKVGVGVSNYLNDETLLPGLATVIRQELMADGQIVAQVQVVPGGRVVVVANYAV